MVIENLNRSYITRHSSSVFGNNSFFYISDMNGGYEWKYSSYSGI